MPKVFKRSRIVTDPKTGQRIRRLTRKYYGEFADERGIRRRVPLNQNKTVAEQMLNEMVKQAALAGVGVVNRFAEQHRRPLTQHLDEFLADLANQGNPAEYCDTVGARARRVLLTEGGFRFVYEIDAVKVKAALARLKTAGLGARTVNHYRQAALQFSRWLVAAERTDVDRLVGRVPSFNAAVDVRRQRREITEEELAFLLQAAKFGKTIYGLTGLQRYRLYVFMIGTGLRASEAASMTPRHFGLASEMPTIRIDAADEKSKRGDQLPIPGWLVDELRPWLTTLSAKQRLWGGTWAEKHNGCKIIEHDLRKARKVWLDEEGISAEERDRREQSDFLLYKTDEGQADIHSLRHTFLSRLGRSGASPKAMQRLARHTDIRLTIGRYTHASLLDLAGAVNRMPPLPTNSGKPTSEVQDRRMTGTDGRPTQVDNPRSRRARVDKELAIYIDSDRQPVTTTDHNNDRIADSRDPPQHSIETDSCNPLIMEDNKREWMGIEPTWRLFSRHTGFEAQGSHQSCVHSRKTQRLLVRDANY